MSFVFRFLASLALLLIGATTAPTFAAPAGGYKSVDVTVIIEGDSPFTSDDVENMVESLLQTAHVAISDLDGDTILEMVVHIAIDDDGTGWAISVEAGAFHQNFDLDSADQLDDDFQSVVSEFYEEYHEEFTDDDDDDDDDPQARS